MLTGLGAEKRGREGPVLRALGLQKTRTSPDPWVRGGAEVSAGSFSVLFLQDLPYHQRLQYCCQAGKTWEEGSRVRAMGWAPRGNGVILSCGGRIEKEKPIPEQPGRSVLAPEAASLPFGCGIIPGVQCWLPYLV